MKAVTFEIELLEPVLVTSLQGDPNSAVAFDYLPGSVIRGAVIQRFIQDYGQFDADSDQGRVLLGDTVHFLNAYLKINQQRSLPAPLHVRRRKSLLLKRLINVAIVQTKQKTSAVNSYFVPDEKDDHKLHIAKPDKLLSIHIERPRIGGERNEKNKDDPRLRREVYQYESLAAGQIFMGAIVCDDDQQGQVFLELLHGAELKIGGARSAGYGRVRFTSVRIDEWWTEAKQNTSLPDQQVSFTLLSDALIRNEQGEYDAGLGALCRALAQRLGVESKVLFDKAGSVLKSSVPFALLDHTLIGGFNRTWGLPLPQIPAAAMGSTVIWKGFTLTHDQIAALERWGIGERRGEGFGRVAVNLLTDETYSVSQEEKPTIVFSAADAVELLNLTGVHTS